MCVCVCISATCAFFFGQTCPERHDHQRFDGVPCGRDQWVLVGAVDSCTQERRGERDYCLVDTNPRGERGAADINMHTDVKRSAGGFEQK